MLGHMKTYLTASVDVVRSTCVQHHVWLEKHRFLLSIVLHQQQAPLYLNLHSSLAEALLCCFQL